MVSRRTRYHLTCSKSATSHVGLWGPNSFGGQTQMPLLTALFASTTCPQWVPPYWNKYCSRCKTMKALCSWPASARTAPLGALWLVLRALTAGGSLRLCQTDGPTLWTWFIGWMAPRIWFSSRTWTCLTHSGRISPFMFTEKMQTCLWAAPWSTASSWMSLSTRTWRPREAACMSQRGPAGRVTSG